MRPRRIALVSRDVAPASAGGIAAYTSALVETLATEAEVTLVTRESLVPGLTDARDAAGRRLLDRVEVVGVPEVGDREQGSYFSPMHRYSALVLDRLREHYGAHGPDLVEVPDYHGEGCVLLQDRAGGSPWLAATTVAVRAHTTAEIVAVLNGAMSDDPRLRVLHEMERFCLRAADALLVGGGDVGGLYDRFYRGRLAPAATVRHPVPAAVGGISPTLDHTGDGPLRLVYAGRLERRKGVLRLVEELRRLREDFRLTIVGADTGTGPLGLPVKDLLRVAIAGDPRFEMLGSADPTEIPAIVAGHDVAVVPSLWECWPNTAFEALAAGVPVLATPVGGLVEIVGAIEPEGGRPGGWLARDTSGAALRERLEELLRRPDEVRDPARRAAARERFDALTARETVVDGYDRLLRRDPRSGRTEAPRRSGPRVTVVVPYFRLGAFVTDAVDSALGQTHRNVAVVVVCDGSFEEDDAVLRALAVRSRVTVLWRANGGLGSARNAGIAASTGEFVVPLDADNVLHPSFVARCLSTLDAHPELSYVTTWSRYVDERGAPFSDVAAEVGWQPITNDASLLEERNVAGDAVALFRREVFDDGLLYDPELTSFEDWFHYLVLRDRGRYGIALPERLVDYRVRKESMLRRVGEPSAARLKLEMQARRRELEVEWCPWNA